MQCKTKLNWHYHYFACGKITYPQAYDGNVHSGVNFTIMQMVMSLKFVLN